MALWAAARIMGPLSGRRTSHQLSTQQVCFVEHFAVAVAREANTRIQEFGPQGLSNIAWALVKMDLGRKEEPRRFVLAAADAARGDLRNFPPQAIANFCWSLSRIEGANEVLSQFGGAAAREALGRPQDFAWQDFAGIMSSVMNLRQPCLPEVHAMASMAVTRASNCCNVIGTQALLNIALAAARLGTDTEVLKPMAMGIASVFVKRASDLNEIDQRQWQEVRQRCGLCGAGESVSGRGVGKKRLSKCNVKVQQFAI